MKQQAWYSTAAKQAARLSGRPATFAIAVLLIVAWLVSGPLFGFSDTEAIQVKLNELIRATQGAHNVLLDLEQLEERQLDQFRARYEKLAQHAREQLNAGQLDTDTPEA